ncbi:LuxR C-terminal-related transcriptional regulator [Streptomyces sp. t39]|uniref:LuxR C-terminal-related transcriptional regulator n=1 Tax=Streptomyces sp. t39 TaxID=1828156 RepID=UPI003966ADC8
MVVTAVTLREDVVDPERPGPGVDPSGAPFLRARLCLPRRPATYLRRARLAGALDRAARAPLTVVNGSAGAGKTLLVADWAAGLDGPVAWMTCDPADRAPGVFWAYVREALRGADPTAMSEVRCPAEAGRVDRRLLARLAIALAGRERPVVLVLDEFERVTAPEIAEQLRFVLHNAGSGLRLVLVTRSEPLLPMHRYRASGEMAEIRNVDLAFTPGEAGDLLALHGLSLPGSTVGGLVRRTQGWAAGIRLCALAARQRPDAETYLKEFEAGRSTVADFLLAEVLDGQSPARQEILLRVSILDRFCPELVDALTLRTDAGAALAALHRENAFVQHLGHSWYSLHPLFAEILRVHLRERRPGLEPELRRRAARWLRGSGALAEALAQGAAAGDWDFTAGALVGDLAIGQLFTGLRSQHLCGLFAGMGPEATGPAPDLVRAALDLSRRDVAHGLASLRRAEEALPGDGGAGPAAAVLSSALLQALAARLAGSPADAEHAARVAEGAWQDVPAQLLEAHPELNALLLTHLGSARLWAGDFDAARAALAPVAASPPTASTALPRLEALGRLALIDHLTGWNDRARHKALAAAEEAERQGLPERAGSLVGRLVLAAVCVERDELDRAEDLLDGAGDDTALAGDPVTAAFLAVVRGRLRLARGDLRGARPAAVPAAVPSPWAEEHTAVVAAAAHLAQGRAEQAVRVLEGAPGGRTVRAVETARALLAAGRADEARDLIEHLPRPDRPGPAVTVRITLVRAQAAHRAGEAGVARRLVAQALLDARREQLRRPFLDAGPWIRPLLRNSPRLHRLAEGWLTTAPGTGGKAVTRPPAERPAPLVPETLSGREREVLERLARMMSTQEIAADLHVSVNTVKTHLKSLYRKLGVNRRTEAVRRARDLSLL